jgi:ABC-type dipeptide/oligopeptide/nickel transport system permease subunit
MDKKTIEIASLIMAIPCFIFLCIAMFVASAYNMNPTGVAILAVLLIFAGAWAALLGQQRLKELRKNGYVKKEEN